MGLWTSRWCLNHGKELRYLASIFLFWLIWRFPKSFKSLCRPWRSSETTMLLFFGIPTSNDLRGLHLTSSWAPAAGKAFHWAPLLYHGGQCGLDLAGRAAWLAWWRLAPGIFVVKPHGFLGVYMGYRYISLLIYARLVHISQHHSCCALVVNCPRFWTNGKPHGEQNPMVS